MRGQYHWKAFFLFLVLYPITSRATLNFSQCLEDMISCANSSQNCHNLSSTAALSYLYFTSSEGFPVQVTAVGDLNTNYTIYMNLSVDACECYCGWGEEAFSWSTFSEEFAAWLLPYLALVSQLPFGSQRRIDNLMSAILTLGSPTLAAYSLYITLLNSRWLNDQLFMDVDYPNAVVRQTVVQVLDRLQHVPLRVHPGRDGRFESLVVHPDNDQWWSMLSTHLDFSHTWSIASATSIAWVAIAYLLTVADSLSNVANDLNSNGQGTGSVWLWLLPIVVGWLVLSPKCDYYRVRDAYNKANEQVCEADSHDPGATPTPVTSNFGLTIGPSPDWATKEIISPDESRIPPVFNYARVLPWSRSVYVTALFYRAAWRKSNRQIGVDGQRITERDVYSGGVPRGCRLGNRDQIDRYCRPDDREYSSAKVFCPPGVLFNMVVASLMALQLQWGTTFAAFLVFWFTPTAGLGCRSLGFLLYGALSTIIWALLVLSNVLDNYADHLTTDDLLAPDPESYLQHTPGLSTSVLPSDSGIAIPLLESRDPNVSAERVVRPNSTDSNGGYDVHTRWRYIRRLSGIADVLRWTGKSLAVISAISVIAISVAQYAKAFDSCFCNSSAISLHSKANIIMQTLQSQIDIVTHAWSGGVALGIISCTFFVGSIYLIRDSLPL